MPRITWADIKASRIPNAIGACPDDPRALQIVNESVERLLNKGHWWGTDVRFRFCATDSCVTLPRQIATLEGVAICGRPRTIRDQYFEFLENGYGIRGQFLGSSGSCCQFSCGDGAVIFRGTVPTQDDITGIDKKLRLVCDIDSDVGKPVLCLGFDSNLNWIRSDQGGTIKDGEIVLLSQAPGTDSVNKFSSVTDIQPPDDLDGQWWLYSLSTTDASQRMLSHYNYDETRPAYSRYFMPICQSASSGQNCNQTLVDAVGKLAFIKMVNDTDYCLIGNIPALKEAAVAVNESEHEPDGVKKVQIINAGLASATVLLNEELQHYIGSRSRPAFDVFFYGDYDEPIPVLI